MSTTTTNYNLVKPELSDSANITAMNSNWDDIDAKMKSNETTANNALPKIATLTTITTSSTLALTHDGDRIKVNGSATVNITVPPNSSVAFPIGAEIEFFNYTLNDVNFVQGSGVTIRSYAGRLGIDGQYSGCVLTKIATDEWILMGALK